MNNTMPMIVSRTEWEIERQALLVREKAHTRAQDALAAARRRLPMVEIGKTYFFDSPRGKLGLVDLFEGRSQLLSCHFMFAPGQGAGCEGCSMSIDSLCHTAHLNARDVTVCAVSRAPLDELLVYRTRMGWSINWYSSFGSDFNPDFGATRDGEEKSLWSVFLRDGNRVFLTYNSRNRGDEMLGSPWSYLDLTPYGRQETWEDSPGGYPQSPPYEWWRRHDEYETGTPRSCCGSGS